MLKSDVISAYTCLISWDHTAFKTEILNTIKCTALIIVICHFCCIKLSNANHAMTFTQKTKPPALKLLLEKSFQKILPYVLKYCVVKQSNIVALNYCATFQLQRNHEVYRRDMFCVLSLLFALTAIFSPVLKRKIDSY